MSFVQSPAEKFPKGDAMKLAELTGLTTAAATQCYTENHSDYCCALASVVQSASNIPPSLFQNAALMSKNAKQINGWLRDIYELVQKVVEKTRCSPNEGWKFCAAAKWDAATAMKGAAAAGGQKLPNIYSQGTGADRNTGSYFNIKGFYETEIVPGCTLTGKNEGFIEANGPEKMRERMLKWLSYTNAMHNAPLEFFPITDPDEETTRVMILDAQRAFNEPVHRKKLVEYIYSFAHELGSYGQAMAYLAGVCLLALTEAETTSILRLVGRDYIKGHWAAEARGFATNAWVTESFMRRRCPAVAAHLLRNNWFPHMYMQKILSGLCIHVLPWTQMFDFLDRFMERGFVYLMAFMLSIVEHFSKQLLALAPQEVSTAFEILKLDPAVVEDSDIRAIIKLTDGEMSQWLAKDMKDHDVDLALLRTHIYDNTPQLAKSLNAAPKEPAFDPCEDCDKNKQIWWCETCEKMLCPECKATNHGGHELEEF